MPTPAEIVLGVAIANLATWAYVVACNWDHGTEVIPAVRSAAIVAVMAAAIGGTLTSLGYFAVIQTDTTALIGAAWRGAMLAAGISAAIASYRARRIG